MTTFLYGYGRTKHILDESGQERRNGYRTYRAGDRVALCDAYGGNLPETFGVRSRPLCKHCERISARRAFLRGEGTSNG